MKIILLSFILATTTSLFAAEVCDVNLDSGFYQSMACTGSKVKINVRTARLSVIKQMTEAGYELKAIESTTWANSPSTRLVFVRK